MILLNNTIGAWAFTEFRSFNCIVDFFFGDWYIKWVIDRKLFNFAKYCFISFCSIVEKLRKMFDPAILELIFVCKQSAVFWFDRVGLRDVGPYTSRRVSFTDTFGLSVWHKNKLSHALKLVLISHRRWFLKTLPPFDTLLPNLKVFPYTVLNWDVEEKASCVCKNNYIQFLLHLRGNFQSFK